MVESAIANNRAELSASNAIYEHSRAGSRPVALPACLLTVANKGPQVSCRVELVCATPALSLTTPSEYFPRRPTRHRGRGLRRRALRR